MATTTTQRQRRVDGFNADCLCISPNGAILALGLAGKAAIRLIRLSDWVDLGDMSMHGDRVKTVAFSSDSCRVAVVAIGLQAMDVNLFYMWDISTQQCVLQQMDFDGKYDNVSHMKLCPIEMVGIGQESIVRVKGATNAIVTFPSCLQSCVSRSHGRLWSGICGDQIFLLSLEGNIPDLAGDLPGLW
jgi:WD40 repeat protein